MTCVVCNKAIGNTELFFTMTCKRHLAHSSHRTVDCRMCKAASVDAAIDVGHPSPSSSSSGLSATGGEISDEAAVRKAMAKERLREPLCPPNPGFIGRMIGGVRSVVTRISESSKPDWESSNPQTLLHAGIPLRDMVGLHGYDITELINDHGVTINDFFQNGYTLTQMCDAFSSRMNPKEGMDVLYNLCTSAEHFRDCADLMEIPVIRKRLGYTGATLRRFGYQFSTGTNMWTLPQLLTAGMTFSDVVAAGMTRRSEWTILKSTGTPQEITAFHPNEAILVDDTVARAPAISHAAVARVATTAVATTGPSARGVPSAGTARSPVHAAAIAVDITGPLLAAEPATYSGPKLVPRKAPAPLVFVTRKK